MAEPLLKRAWRLFWHNPVAIVPPLIVGILAHAATVALTSEQFGDIDTWNSGGPNVFVLYLHTIVGIGIAIASNVVSIALTIGIAGAAWERGRGHISDGFAALARAPLSVLFAAILLAALGFAAAALLIPTFGLSVVAYAVLAIYTMPAVVLGRRSATDAFLDSCSLAAHHLGTTILVVIAIAVTAMLAGAIATLLQGVAFAGALVDALASSVAVAYATFVICGAYLQSREADAPKTVSN